MKTLISGLLLSGLLLTLQSCTDDPNSKIYRQTTKYKINRMNSALEVLTIDSCEYLYGEWGNATVLTHKGNCKYCVLKIEDVKGDVKRM